MGARLLESGSDFAGAWNFGPGVGEVWTVRDVAEKLCALWGTGSCRYDHAERGPHEARWLRLDCSKALLRLGWHSTWDVETALQKTVEWYKLHQAGAAPGELSALMAAQVEQYSGESNVLG